MSMSSTSPPETGSGSPPPAAAAPPGLDTAQVARRGHHPAMALLVLVTCQLMVGLDGTVVNIALPSIGDSLHISPTNLAWVANAYFLPFGGLLLLGGRAGDILGRRRLFIGGITLFTLASLLGGFAPNSEVLLLARALQGLGAAFAAPGTYALIATNFEEGPPRNRALAVVTGAYGMSFVLGLLLGGVITEWTSWRWVLFINVPIGLFLVLLTPLYVNESRRNPGRFDLLGALTSTAGMTFLVYGLIRAASDGWDDSLTVTTLVVGVVLMALFALVELRVVRPITPLHLLRDHSRTAAYAIVLLLAAPQLGGGFFMTQFLQNVLEFSPLKAGFAFLPLAAGLMTTGGMAAQLLPRLGPKPIMLAGIVLLTAGTVWFTQLSVTANYWPSVVGPMLVSGLGAGAAFTALNQLILTGVPGEDSGAASGLLETMQWVGGALGVAIFVAVFGELSANATNPPAGASPAQHALAEGMAGAYVAGVVFDLVALVLAVAWIRALRPARTGTELPAAA